MRRYGSEANHRWVGFEHRPGDIVISTRSKCGTTWAQMICALLVFQTPDLPAPLGELSPWLDWDVEPLDVVTDRLAGQTHRRIIKTHTPLDGVPMRPDVTYVVVGRHPLDVAVSLHHHGRNIDRERVAELNGRPIAAGPEASFADWFPTWLAPEANAEDELDTLPGLVHHVTDAWSHQDEPNVVLLHYQDLTDDLGEEMRALADHLGIAVAEDRWPALIEAASFGSMQRRAEQLVPDRLGVLQDPRAFFRSGRSGEGRDVIAPELVHRYETEVRSLGSPAVIGWLEHST